MLILEADKNNLKVLQKELVTSGSVSLFRGVRLNEDWDGMNRVAVFTNGIEMISIRGWDQSVPDPLGSDDRAQ